MDLLTPKKRPFDAAFERKKLDSVQMDDILVEHTIYKVKKRIGDCFDIKTSENVLFNYDRATITETATSATLYNKEEKLTKTEIIQLFSSLSPNDIWSAVYLKKDPNPNWQAELVAKIQRMPQNDAVKYLKKDFTTIGKITRELKGQKIFLTSNNNYYMVRDLKVHFDLLEEGVCAEVAAKDSTRQLDVNTLQSLIFNSVKYVLK